MRKMKNVVNNYPPSQVKVREATSNDPWGPSSSVMSEIADLTYNVVAFSEIMSMIWKRLNDHGKNWRHVYKALMLLEYIIKTGSERVAQQCKENIFAIQTLKDFQFLDRDGKDQGMNVREKSKNLVLLLKDDDRLKTERTRALKAKERFAQASQGIGSEQSPTGNADGTPQPNGENGTLGTNKTIPAASQARNKTIKEHSDDRNKTMKDKMERSKTKHNRRARKSIREGNNPADKPKEEEVMTSTGAIMIPVTQQFWWKVGLESNDSNSDYDDEMLSASSGTPPLQRDLSSEIEQARPQTTGEEELQLQLALAMSREEADEMKKKDRSDDVRLQMALTESVDGKPIPANASTLLNLAEPVQQQSPANADPWGVPVATANNDPWGAGPKPDPVATMPTIPHDPWSSQPDPAYPPPVPAEDPWAPPGSVPPPGTDAWGGSPTNIPPMPTANDPWKSTLAQTAPGSDPWGSTRPTDPDAEFDMLHASSPPNTDAFSSSQMQGQSTGDAFNMYGMSSALQTDLQNQQKKKSPKDFLGVNSSLVNLDSLISPAPQPTQVPANPFLGTATAAAAAAAPPGTTSAAANPFHQQRMPAPTINQIRSAPGATMNVGGSIPMGIAMGGSLLPQPLMPVTQTPLVPQSQPQQQTNNPFLM